MGLLQRVSATPPNSSGYTSKSLLKRILHSQETENSGITADVCIQRILRLSGSKHDIFTALSILKAYYPFEAALCLVNKKKSWTIFASVCAEIPDSEILPDIPTILESMDENEYLQISAKSFSTQVNPFATSDIVHVFSPLKTVRILIATSTSQEVAIQDIAKIIRSTITVFTNTAIPSISKEQTVGVSITKIDSISEKSMDTLQEYFQAATFPRSCIVVQSSSIISDAHKVEIRNSLHNLGFTYFKNDQEIYLSPESKTDAELLIHRLNKTMAGLYNFSLKDDFLANTPEELLSKITIS